MSRDPNYRIAINDALTLISKRQGELDSISDFPLAGRTLDELEALYQQIDALAKDDDPLGDVVEHHKEAARARGFLTGDIHQTDAWFREAEGGRS